MGNAQTRTIDRYDVYGPTIIDDPRPAGTSITGISIAQAQECNACKMVIDPGISSSSIRLTRDYGDISREECSRWSTDGKKMDAGELSFQEFLGRMQSGQYYQVNQSGTHCTQRMFNAEDAAKMKKRSDYNESLLQSGRVRKISDGGFSLATKVQLKPSIPFRVTVSSKTVPNMAVNIDTMTLYHPSPMRIENVQHDAVLSLNDPSVPGTKVVILVPVVAGTGGEPTKSSDFMARILQNMSRLRMADPSTGQYPEVDAPTGKDWTLDKILPTNPETNEVSSGLFIWESMPELEQYVAVNTRELRRTSWRRKSGTTGPVYVMLETPITISSRDFAELVQFPVTPPEQALPEMIGQSLVYKCGGSGGGVAVTGSSTTEGFTVEHYKTCDPFFPNYEKPDGYSPEQALRIAYNVLVFLAIGAGAWIALVLVADFRADQLFQKISFGVGRVIVRIFKGTQAAAQFTARGGQDLVGTLMAKYGRVPQVQ